MRPWIDVGVRFAHPNYRAGDVISTGMITGVHDIRIGQQSRHVFAGVGEVQVKITTATAIAG